jgi:hypothetical protein
MEERTLINPVPTDNPATFRFREDYLFFGLLVRHGLAQPEHHAALVAFQHERHPVRPLAKLLVEHANLPEKTRRDIDELLSILATKDLAKYLPAEIPEIDTIVHQHAEATRLITPHEHPTLHEEATDQGRTELADDIPATVIAATSPQQGRTAQPTNNPGWLSNLSGSFDLSNVGTFLTQAEIERVERAKPKGALIGTIMGGHLVLDKLGGGGQGDVYLAKQLSLNRYVALKKLEIPHWASRSTFVETFRQEARTLGAINHARIVKVYEIFSEGDADFFTMEYLNGKTVKDLVKDAGGALPLDIVANIACQACSALGRTAQDGLVHRDIKPANIMLDENGDLKIVDFGLAGAAAAFESPQGFAGTPQFCAPEQVTNEALTPATDQYSMGLTLYYMLTGKTAFPGNKVADILEAQVMATPPAPSSLNEQLPKAVDRVIMRMLEKNPAKRYASFEECYNDWEKVLAAAGRRAPVGSNQLLGESLLRVESREKEALKRNGVLLSVAWLALVLGTVLGEFQVRRLIGPGFLEFCGDWGTALLAFSLSCIGYVAMARRKWLPTIGSLRTWLYVHIATAIPSVIMILVHSGNFLRGVMPGGAAAKPWLSILVSLVLLVTAVSGTVGLLIFRVLRRQLLAREMELRASGAQPSPREQMMMVLSARFLSGWRLVHYPLAILFVLLSIVHILHAIRFESM